MFTPVAVLKFSVGARAATFRSRKKSDFTFAFQVFDDWFNLYFFGVSVFFHHRHSLNKFNLNELNPVQVDVAI